jgi:hypothetical protein
MSPGKERILHSRSRLRAASKLSQIAELATCPNFRLRCRSLEPPAARSSLRSSGKVSSFLIPSTAFPSCYCSCRPGLAITKSTTFAINDVFPRRICRGGAILFRCRMSLRLRRVQWRRNILAGIRHLIQRVPFQKPFGFWKYSLIIKIY